VLTCQLNPQQLRSPHSASCIVLVGSGRAKEEMDSGSFVTHADPIDPSAGSRDHALGSGDSAAHLDMTAFQTDKNTGHPTQISSKSTLAQQNAFRQSGWKETSNECGYVVWIGHSIPSEGFQRDGNRATDWTFDHQHAILRVADGL